MRLIADGRVLHGGTLNGNPLSLAAARAVLEILSRDDGAVYGEMWRRGERLRFGLEEILRGAGFEAVTSGAGPVFQVSFMCGPPHYREPGADKQITATSTPCWTKRRRCPWSMESPPRTRMNKRAHGCRRSHVESGSRSITLS